MAQTASPFRQLSGNRRFFGFVIGTSGAALSLGAFLVAQIAYASAVAGAETGLGAAKVAFMLGAAVVSIPAGALVDRASAPLVLLISLLVLAAVFGVIAAFLLAGALTVVPVVVLSAAEGVATGVALPALAVTQAGLVAPDARGAAEIVNIARLWLGLTIGSMLGQILDPGPTVMICAVAMALSGLCAYGFGRTSVRRAAPQTGERMRFSAFVAQIRRAPGLGPVVIAELVMRVVVPTTLIGLALIDADLEHDAGWLMAAGSLGVLTGIVALLWRGVLGELRWGLRIAFSGYCLALLIGAAVLTDAGILGPDHDHLMLFLLAFSGSAFSAFGIGTLSSTMQQRSPDAIRGRLSGAMAVPRLTLQAIATLVMTVFIAQLNTRTVVAGLAVLTIAAMFSLRLFGPIDDQRRPAV